MVSTVYRLDRATRDEVERRLAALLRDRTDLSFAMAFGSFISSKPFRDLDVAVWTRQDASSDLDSHLASMLSDAVGMPVDVRRINDAPVPFLFHALRGRVLVAADAVLLATLMERVARIYHDLAPRLRQATREAFAK
jgi:hypothetical protein